jgi:hypothetical protein
MVAELSAAESNEKPLGICQRRRYIQDTVFGDPQRLGEMDDDCSAMGNDVKPVRYFVWR